MITVSQIQTMLGDSFFNGDLNIAGMVIFSVVMALIFSVFKGKSYVAIVLLIPCALIFSTLGVLPMELTMLLIVIAVLILAMSAKKTFGE